MNLYNVPYTARTIEESIRSFADLLNNSPNSKMRDYAEDYSLYHIGDFDEDTGKIVALDQPYSISYAKDLLKVKDDVK